MRALKVLNRSIRFGDNKETVKLEVFSELTGKVAVVTGASRGIGRGIAEALAQYNMRLALVATNDSVSAVAEELSLRGVEAVGFVTDLRCAAEREQLVDQVIKHFGKVDLLVNNAGVARIKSALELTEEDWEQTLQVNLMAPFFLSCKMAARWIEEKREGCIVNIASQAAEQAFDGHTAYSASKGGLLAMTSVQALEWGAYGIRVNCISPGLVYTEMAKENWGSGEAVLRKLALPRFAQPKEIGYAVAYLASDAARAVTNLNLKVDSGPKRLF